MGRAIDSVDLALADALRRVDSGERITLEALRSLYPAHWREVHDVLALDGWLHSADEAPRGPGSSVGPFRLVAPLGGGASATAWVARAEGPGLPAGVTPGDEVCLKILRARSLASKHGLRRAEREARLGMTIRHPCVVAAFALGAGHGAGDAPAWIAMELVRGPSLRRRLTEEGAMPESAVLAMGGGIASGLAAIHAAGAVHRDLKPENILIRADGTPQIADLGIAACLADPTQTGRRRFLGSIRYAAPEQLGGDGPAGPAADLFALGLILFEAAAGIPAFRSSSPADAAADILSRDPPPLDAVVPDASPFLCSVVTALLRRAPADRLGPAADVASILHEGEASPWWLARREMSVRSRRDAR